PRETRRSRQTPSLATLRPAESAGKSLTIHARHFASGSPIEVRCENGRIVSVTEPTAETGHIQAGWVAPALFDVQINGCDGFNFSSTLITVEGVRHVVETCRRHGIAGFCPTLVTNSYAALAHGMSILRQVHESAPEMARAIPAIHLEGPYISPD